MASADRPPIAINLRAPCRRPLPVVVRGLPASTEQQSKPETRGQGERRFDLKSLPWKWLGTRGNANNGRWLVPARRELGARRRALDARSLSRRTEVGLLGKGSNMVPLTNCTGVQ